MKSHFLKILERHVGKENAVGLATLAEQLDTDERRVRLLKRELVEEGHFIGATCNSKRPGYFLIQNKAEIDATIRECESRAMSLLALIKAYKGADEFAKFVGQLNLEFQK